MDNTETQTVDWKCNTCGASEGVENGVCPECGPTQTTPVSDTAKKEAGIVTEEEKAEAEAQTEVAEPTSTEK
ncbi:MAG: hypothetical protein ABI067_06770 [Leifsonia sp.]